MPDVPSIVVIVNPDSRRFRRGNHESILRKLFEQKGIPVDIRRSQNLWHAREMAGEAARNCNLVVAAGGDGTVRYLACELRGAEAVLGVLPMGSGNDLCTALEIPYQLDRAVDILRDGRCRKMDFGMIKGYDGFVNTLGIGFDGLVGYEAGRIRSLRGMLKYTWVTLKHIFSYRSSIMTITLDGKVIRDCMLMVTIANGPMEGGGIRVAPSADPFDGFLDVVMIRDLNMIRRIILFLRILIGLPPGPPVMESRKVRSISVQSESPVYAHADGELLDKELTSLEVHVEPQSVQVMTGPYLKSIK